MRRRLHGRHGPPTRRASRQPARPRERDLPADRDVGRPRGDAQADGDLAVGDLARRTRVLPLHAHRARPLLEEPRVLEDPRTVSPFYASPGPEPPLLTGDQTEPDPRRRILRGSSRRSTVCATYGGAAANPGVEFSELFGSLLTTTGTGTGTHHHSRSTTRQGARPPPHVATSPSPVAERTSPATCLGVEPAPADDAPPATTPSPARPRSDHVTNARRAHASSAVRYNLMRALRRTSSA